MALANSANYYLQLKSFFTDSFQNIAINPMRMIVNFSKKLVYMKNIFNVFWDIASNGFSLIGKGIVFCSAIISCQSMGENMQVEGKLEGKIEGKIEIAKSMLAKGYSLEDIMLLTGLFRSHIQGIV